MCRLAAYLGPPISLRQFFLAPAHSLYRQSWDPRELTEARLNADGYGVAWQQADGRMGRYTQPMAAWNDLNLPSLADALTSPMWLGNVRSATPGQTVHAINTQPYAVDRLAMTHNGYLSGLAQGGRGRMLARLSDQIQADLHGTTDSEYLFALVRQALVDQATSLEQALAIALEQAVLDTGHQPALLNVCLSDGQTLVFSRYSVDRPNPSLYWHPAHPAYAGGLLLASERFDEDPGWREVQTDSLTVLEPSQPPRQTALPQPRA